jgi:hypothetical protein
MNLQKIGDNKTTPTEVTALEEVSRAREYMLSFLRTQKAICRIAGSCSDELLGTVVVKAMSIINRHIGKARRSENEEISVEWGLGTFRAIKAGFIAGYTLTGMVSLLLSDFQSAESIASASSSIAFPLLPFYKG